MSALSAGSAWVDVLPDVSNFGKELAQGVQPALDDTHKRMQSTGLKLGAVGAGLTMGVTAPIVAIGKAAFESLGEISKLKGQTEAVLKSTGGIAGVTAGEVDALAQSIERATGIEAEAVTEGQNLLLTFTNIRNRAGEGNDIFNQATTALTDMATAMGTEPKAAAIQLGKALNDPIKGVTSLGRAGVQFTEDQKAMIASLVETGDVAGAQKVILGELNTQFGGSAAAFGDTMPGKLAKAKNSFDNLTESLVESLLPALDPLLDLVTRAIDFFGNLPGPVKTGIAIFAALAAVVGPLLVLFGSVIGAVGTIGSVLGAGGALAGVLPAIGGAFGALLGPVGLVIAAIAGVIAIGYLVWKHWDKISAFLRRLWEGMKRVVGAVWDGIKNAVVGAVRWIRDVIVAYVRGYIAFWRGAWNLVLNLLRAVWRNIVAGVRAGVQFVRDLFSNMVAGVRDGISRAWSFITGLPRQIMGAFSNAGRWLFNAGRDIVVGLWNGLVGMGRWLWNKITGWIKDVVPGPVLRVLGIASPSKLFAAIGADTVAGLALGIEAATPQAGAAAEALADTVAQRGQVDALGATVDGHTGARAAAFAGAERREVGGVAVDTLEVNLHGVFDLVNPAEQRRLAERLRALLVRLEAEGA